MRCLVVGGSGFLGGAIAKAALTSGHEVAVLSRGTAGRSVPAGAEAIRADRHGDLSVLEGRRFDGVFDTCAYAPTHVRTLLDGLGPETGRYILISSISAYGRYTRPGLTEDEAVPDATEDDLDLARGVPAQDLADASAYGAAYGPLKRACEIAADEVLGRRATSLRAGLLVGAGDYTDRLTWWVRRIDAATGHRSRIPAPAPPERPVQFVDVRDVADFALRCVESGLSGIWNVTGRPIGFGELLEGIASVSGTQPEVEWVSEAQIEAVGAQPWTDIPLMVPGLPEFRHMLEIDTSRAVAAGLRTRPLSETLEDVLAWDRGRRDQPLKAGLGAEQEAALLGLRAETS